MSNSVVAKKVYPRNSIRATVTESFRERILSGDLPPGSLLPSTKELARQYRTGVANIHHAMSTLVKEGVISRRPKIGTVVNDLKQKLERVAVYLPMDINHPAATFLRLLLMFTEKELNRHGIESLAVHENREMSGLRQIRHLASTRRIQGAIMPGARRSHVNEFRRMNVPFVCLSSLSIDNRVATNRKQLIEYAFRSFKRQNCSSAGLLCSYSPPSQQDNDRDESAAKKAFHSMMLKTAKKYKIELKPEWSVVLPQESVGLEFYERFAFEGFKKIWSNNEKPDGLFVYTDDLITGTLMAIMHEKINIPGDLKLVMHHNLEALRICPVPCVLIENSVRETAAALVSQLLDLYNGKKVKPIVINYHVKEHKGD